MFVYPDLTVELSLLVQTFTRHNECLYARYVVVGVVGLIAHHYCHTCFGAAFHTMPRSRKAELQDRYVAQSVLLWRCICFASVLCAVLAPPSEW